MFCTFYGPVFNDDHSSHGNDCLLLTAFAIWNLKKLFKILYRDDVGILGFIPRNVLFTKHSVPLMALCFMMVTAVLAMIVTWNS